MPAWSQDKDGILSVVTPSMAVIGTPANVKAFYFKTQLRMESDASCGQSTSNVRGGSAKTSGAASSRWSLHLATLLYLARFFSNFGDGTMCLIESLCKEGQWAPDQLWSDYHSGASECGKAWGVVPAWNDHQNDLIKWASDQPHPYLFHGFGITDYGYKPTGPVYIPDLSQMQLVTNEWL
jgi:hypothetical protein